MTSAGTPGTDEALHDLDADLVERVERIQREQLALRREHLAGIASETTALIDALERYLEGGKLLRPRFCFWGGVAALHRAPGPDEIESLARVGAAIELVQAAALMHDDVIDHSPTRRGRPALHVAAADRHHDRSLSGSAEDFGIAVAIVLGDLALTWAEQMAAAPLAAPATGARARAEFDLLRTEVMSGQFLDVLHQAGGFASAPDPEQAALSVIRWKTVPYTVLRPVRLGAAMMGAEEPALELLAHWAIEVGTAFQLRDDLLSVVGDEDETGKPIGGDIVEGKRTVLLARATAAAGPGDRELLERTVGRAGAGAEQVAAVHRVLVETGAVGSVAHEVRERAERARALLEDSSVLGRLGTAGLAALAAQATDLGSLPSSGAQPD